MKESEYLLYGDNRFTEFWGRYPKKKARLAAIKAWVKLKPEDQFAAIDGVRKYMLSGDWSNPQFIPYPATFLNGRRWEDEIGGEHCPHGIIRGQWCSQCGKWVGGRLGAVYDDTLATPPPRYCATCGHTGSWHKNELHHGRNPGHEFVLQQDTQNVAQSETGIVTGRM